MAQPVSFRAALCVFAQAIALTALGGAVASGQQKTPAPTFSELENGVIKPPKIADPEFVIPAPDVGKIEVIPPDEAPEQSGKTPTREPYKAAPDSDSFKAGDVIEAIASSSIVAGQLADWRTGPPVAVIDTAALFQGANLAAFNASLNEHAHGIAQLRAVISSNGSLAEALEARDVKPETVVAIAIGESGGLTVFVR